MLFGIENLTCLSPALGILELGIVMTFLYRALQPVEPVRARVVGSECIGI